MTDHLLDQANDVLERITMLDDVLAEARSFRALLADLHRRDLTVVKEPHVAAIGMVRATILDVRA